MNFQYTSSLFNPAFFDLYPGSSDLEQNFQFYGGRQQPAYHGMSVQRMDDPFPVYLNQSAIHHYGAGFSGLLKEYEIAPVASANPAGYSRIDMSEIPPPALEKYAPRDYRNQPVNGALPPIPNIHFTQPLFPVKSEPGIREPTPAHHYNPGYWLTRPPVVFFNPQDSGPVAVVHSLNLNQATSNNQSTQTEEMTDGSSSIIEDQRVPRQEPTYAKHKCPYSTYRYQTDPEYAERQRKRQKERYHNDPEYAERVKKRQRDRARELLKDPAYRERQKIINKKYRMKRKKIIESMAGTLFAQNIKGNTTSQSPG